MPRGSRRTISLSFDTYIRLVRIKGKMTLKRGRLMSFENVIEELLDLYEKTEGDGAQPDVGDLSGGLSEVVDNGA